LVKNDRGFLPFKDLKKKRAYVPLGEMKDEDRIFKTFLNKYDRVDRIEINSGADLNKLDAYDEVIIAVFKNTSNPWKSYKLSDETKSLIEKISAAKPSVTVIFTSPYALNVWKNELPSNAVVVAYQNNPFTRKIVPQLLFGALAFEGKLPVSINKKYPVNTGIATERIGRLAYGYPEQEGMDSRKLVRGVDSVMQVMLDTMAAPGGVVLAARNGRIVFLKKYGYKTYDTKEPLHADDVFDVASVTKVLAATASMMKLYDEKYFELDDRLGEMLPYLKGSNKDTLILRAVLSHYAQLKPWIPFYLSTVDSVTKKLKPGYYRQKPEPGFEIKVAENMYLISSYPDTIWQKIKESPLRKKKEYKYSGLFFYLWKKYMLERLHTDIDRYVDSVFYQSIGAHSLTYNAWKRFPKEKIVPSEIDTYWRHQELRGYVHDMGAAMLNWVNGNAGLFGNAEDLAKMMQMFLQNGYYGGKRYISGTTVKVFTSRHYAQDSVRRGLGWDKPQFKGEVGPTFEEISATSFGHQGFTGTMVWADPEEKIVYVFLSNRTYPGMNNRLLYKLNIRSEVQRMIYLSVKNPKYDYRDQYKLKGIPYPWEAKGNKH
jgi:CubicO group peptidase (beta-lactamase class C family)